MKLRRHVWQQLKSITCEKLIAALKKDGWEQDTSRGAILVFISQRGKRVTIHYHPGKTYGEKLLKGLIKDIGWTEQDLIRLKLIKRVG